LIDAETIKYYDMRKFRRAQGVWVRQSKGQNKKVINNNPNIISSNKETIALSNSATSTSPPLCPDHLISAESTYAERVFLTINAESAIR